MPGTNAFTVAWGVLFALGLVLEGIALWAGRGTLSGHVWHLLGTSVGRPIVLAVFLWLLWHWFLEPGVAAGLRSTYVDDGLIAAMVAVLAVLGGRRRP